MPLAANSLPSELTIQVEDFNRETSGTSLFLPNGFSLVDIVTNVAAFEAVIAALTDGYIRSGGLSRRFRQTTALAGGIAPISSNVQRKGVFIFENSFGTYNTYQVPSIARTLVVPGTKQLDRANVAILAYEALMTNGLAGVPGSTPIGGNGYDLVRLVDAYEDSVDKPD
jgi:hypothetical protein